MIDEIQTGDIVLHLRGVHPNAVFVGYSQASSGGYETADRPPDPKAWSFSKRFYRADLKDYVPFHDPMNLVDIFLRRRNQLIAYFDNNKAKSTSKQRLFYVRQAGRLQCLNGAYLSRVDDQLFTALFDKPALPHEQHNPETPTSVETGWQLATVKSRIGQAAFSSAIKELYGDRCCFPGCHVSDSRFLIGAHIARWSDNPKLRGELGNGLCLCLMHDKAFEHGIFTLDHGYRIYINPQETDSESLAVIEIFKHRGEQIRLSTIQPLRASLQEHWDRINVQP